MRGGLYRRLPQLAQSSPCAIERRSSAAVRFRKMPRDDQGLAAAQCHAVLATQTSHSGETILAMLHSSARLHPRVSNYSAVRVIFLREEGGPGRLLRSPKRYRSRVPARDAESHHPANETAGPIFSQPLAQLGSDLLRQSQARSIAGQ